MKIIGKIAVMVAYLGGFVYLSMMKEETFNERYQKILDDIEKDKQ